MGVGHEGIIDLEREAELGGPIHTSVIGLEQAGTVGRHYFHHGEIERFGEHYQYGRNLDPLRDAKPSISPAGNILPLMSPPVMTLACESSLLGSISMPVSNS